MSYPTGLKPVFGAASFGKQTGRAFSSTEAVRECLDTVAECGIKNIDTAQIYGEGWSEEVLGECRAGDRFILDTKAYGGIKPMSATEEGIVEKGLESVKKLGVKQLDIFYIHAPATDVPLASTLAGIHALHQRGAFTRFGLSNYPAADVEAVHTHCAQNGYILPTVYQGNYNPVARKQETVLLPTLRRLGIAFYAYSPIAGGFLTKTKQQVLDGAGRFDPSTPVGKMYRGLYARPTYLEVLAEWEEIADEEGCSGAELAYRWVAHNSALRADLGDAIIIGASSVAQIRQTVDGLKRGPLTEEAVGRIEAIWEKIRHEAPLDNMNP